MELELNETQIDYVRCLLSEDLDRNRGHIEWLQSADAADEEDKDLQHTEC